MANKEQNLEYIRSQMSLPELLTVLAEEAAELGQAALKYRRTLIKGNPTPTSERSAYANILEELGDILNSLEAMELDLNNPIIHAFRKSKIERWAERLHEEEAKQKELADNGTESTAADEISH